MENVRLVSRRTRKRGWRFGCDISVTMRRAVAEIPTYISLCYKQIGPSLIIYITLRYNQMGPSITCTIYYIMHEEDGPI